MPCNLSDAKRRGKRTWRRPTGQRGSMRHCFSLSQSSRSGPPASWRRRATSGRGLSGGPSRADYPCRPNSTAEASCRRRSSRCASRSTRCRITWPCVTSRPGPVRSGAIRQRRFCRTCHLFSRDDLRPAAHRLAIRIKIERKQQLGAIFSAATRFPCIRGTECGLPRVTHPWEAGGAGPDRPNRDAVVADRW